MEATAGSPGHASYGADGDSEGEVVEWPVSLGASAYDEEQPASSWSAGFDENIDDTENDAGKPNGWVIEAAARPPTATAVNQTALARSEAPIPCPSIDVRMQSGEGEAQVSGDVGLGMEAAATQSAKRARRGVRPSDERLLSPQVPTLATTMQYSEVLDTSTIYQLLVDESQMCNGRRPDFLHDADIGKVYVERSNGKPPLEKRRRRNGLDKWLQGTELQPQKIDVHDQRGEVWLRTVYGKVRRGSSRVEVTQARALHPVKSFKYHQYELHFYRAGRKVNTSHVGIGRATHLKQAAKLGGDIPDWVLGTLYHVRKDPDEPAESSSSKVIAPGLTQVQGILELQLQPSDDRWIQLKDAAGADSGGLLSGPHGPTLTGPSGDFAEWHIRDPSERPFDEGDLVAIGANGLTRVTDNAHQLAVISRRAIVVGSRPDSSKIMLYDQIAYCGRVPVKLRGSDFRQGDFVVPSGYHDGTAMAIRGMPQVSVGQTLEKGNGFVAQYSTLLELCCCTRREKRAQWKLVTIAVYGPAFSAHKRPRCTATQILLVVFAALFVVVLSYYYSRRRCVPVKLLHGTMHGVCDGTPGSHCTYGDCDQGLLLPVATPHDSTTRGVNSDDMGPTTLVCNAASMFHTVPYTGPQYECVVAPTCPQTNQINLSRIGLCSNCDAHSSSANMSMFMDKDAIVAFPQTHLHMAMAECPAGFSGRVYRRCFSGDWGPIEGNCSRQWCRSLHVPVNYEEPPETCLNTSSREYMTPACQSVRQHVVSVDPTAEGVTRVSPCPWPGYSGQIVARCGANSSKWLDVRARCKRQVCPATWANISMSSEGAKHRVLLPELQRAQSPEVPTEDHAAGQLTPPWVSTPCCNRFSATGSCLDADPAFGVVAIRCDEAGRHRVRNVSTAPSDAWTAFQCAPESIVAAKLDQQLETATILYHKLVENHADQVSNATKGAWRLPPTGVLAGISVALKLSETSARPPDWRSVNSAASDHSTDCFDEPDCRSLPVTIETTAKSGNVVPGRAISAFADTSCRQLGYKRAVLVTNCLGLQWIELGAIRRHQNMSDGGIAIHQKDMEMSLLFSTQCPSAVLLDVHKSMLSWLEVRQTDDAGDSSWLRYMSQNHSGLLATTYGAGPLPASSSCSGKESNLAACFIAQVEAYRRGQRSLQYRRPAYHKLIVGCSNDESTSKGTWVLGDSMHQYFQGYGYRFDIRSTTIVTGYGVYSCSTGAELTPNDLPKASPADLCWGKAMEA